MEFEFSTKYLPLKDAVLQAVENFGTSGESFVEGKRNSIRIFTIGAGQVNIKSFRVPSFLNKIVYRYFRKSKARRSFEFASKLKSMGIGTPAAVGFVENYDAFGLCDSYYASEHLQADLLFKDLVSFPDFPDHENILRQFTAFSWKLHDNGVEFLDHSPGNTLIKKNAEGKYEFFLVDLNRMKFHENIPFEKRMKNLSRLTPKKEMVAVMANEYAKHSGEPEAKVFEALWNETAGFQRRFHRKKALKKKLAGKK